MQMRLSTDKCLLCLEKEATQKGSHIIPKFFGQGLFYGTSPRHAILWLKGGKRTKVQDIMKEDYILCSECEKSISIYETYCALRLERYQDIRFLHNFNHLKLERFECTEYLDLDIRIFNLLVYSIVWRVSISNNYGFLPFKLPHLVEESLRQIMKDFSSTTQNDLIDKLDKLKSLPNFSHILIRPKNKLRPPSSMLSASSHNEWLHQLHLVDYVLFFFTKSEKLFESFSNIDNNRLSGFVRVAIAEKDKWKNFNIDMIKEAIK